MTTTESCDIQYTSIQVCIGSLESSKDPPVYVSLKPKITQSSRFHLQSASAELFETGTPVLFSTSWTAAVVDVVVFNPNY